MSTTSDVLRRAADRMEEFGKCEGLIYDTGPNGETPRDGCAMCCIGAIQWAAGRWDTDWWDTGDSVSPEVFDLISQVARTLASHLGLDAGEAKNRIYAWSDDNDAETVIRAMREAADAADV